jgi:hypothetical protein
MNDKLLDYFFFFLLRDHLAVGNITNALQDAELAYKYDGLSPDTDVTVGIIELSEKLTDRFLLFKIAG